MDFGSTVKDLFGVSAMNNIAPQVVCVPERLKS